MVGSCDKLFTDPPDIPHCRYCGFKTRYDYTNPLFKLSKKTMDISYTYDGACIVSDKWKSFCIESDFSNVSESYCEYCHSFNAVAGPVFDSKNQPQKLGKGIYRTDILFGSGNEKSPIIIVSEETRKMIIEAKIKGCYFRQIS